MLETAPRTDTGLAALLHGSVIQLFRRLRAERVDTSLTVSQISVLNSLAARGVITLGELAAHERVQPPTMTRMVAKLVDRGLIDRAPHPTDGRQVLLSISEQGSAFLAEDRRVRYQWLDGRLKTLTPAERDLLRKAVPLLRRIAAS